MKLLTALLPKSPSLHVETRHVDEATSQLTLCLTSMQPWGYCPRCRCPTRRIHSRYNRTVADLPWASLRVRLPPARAEVFLHQQPLPAPHFYRTLAASRCALGAAHSAAGPRSGAHRYGPRRCGRIAVEPTARYEHQSEHLATPPHAGCRCHRSVPPPCSAWTILPCANARPTGQCSLIWSATAPWPYCLIVRLRPLLSGSSGIVACR